MKMTRFAQYLEKHRSFPWLVIAMAILVGLGGCGYKSRPVPPQQVVPRAITDLRYELSEKGVALQWSFPQKTVGGKDLAEINSFDLYRAVVPVDAYCPDCPIPYGAPISLPGGSLVGNKIRPGSYESSLLRPGHFYFFKIRSRIGWWAESADSNVVSFLWYTPPQPPQGLRAQAGDGEVKLVWQPVTANLDGTPIKNVVAYQVYKSVGGEDFAALGEPTTELGMVDRQVATGKKYFYKIQAVGVYEQGKVGGGFSSEVAVVPVDRTPPVPPTEVRAIGTAKGVKVFWNPSEEADVKEYVIYRRLKRGEWQRLDSINVPYTLFNDPQPPAQAPCWYYSVTAVDNATPGNESAKSAEAKVCQ